MPPLAQVQYNNVMSTLFGIEDVEPDVTIDVSVIAWASGAANPIIGMTTYGNMIDDRTNDPTAILPLFAFSYNIACQWPSNDDEKGGKSAGASRVSRRPVEIPAR